MKTKEELDSLKEEVAALNKKLAELSKEELEQVAGGEDPNTSWLTPTTLWVKCPTCGTVFGTDRVPAVCPDCGLEFYP